MSEEKRMAGSYEITQAFCVGDKEIVFGVDAKNKDGKKYMVAFCEQNEIFASYTDVLTSDDYAEIVNLYAERISAQAEKLKTELEQLAVPVEVITAEQCYLNDYSESIDGKVIAISLSALRPEYQRADRQIYLVDGGFGANAKARGSAVFCINVYSGERTRWERRDVEGVIKAVELPEWAKKRLKVLLKEEKSVKKTANKEAR